MLVEVYALEDASCILKKTSATLVTAASRAFAKSPDAMEHRIGRLLPPYLTRLQQRYSAYLQRPGLSRIPRAALPVIPALTPAAPAPDPAVSAPALAKIPRAPKPPQKATKKSSPAVLKRESTS